jgi:mannosyltransferase
MHASLRLSRRSELLILAAILVAGLALHLATLGAKGLSYDEAATALRAFAGPAQIVAYQADASFQHPPLWFLTMHYWVKLFGESETSLRLLPALCGVGIVLLTWLWLRSLWPARAGLRLLAAGMVATAPILIYYSQDARMYTPVVLLALLSLLAAVALVRRPALLPLVGFVVVNWLMTGYHYYSLLLIAIEGFFFVLVAMRQRVAWRTLALWLTATAASFLAISAWMAWSPGFHETLALVLGGVETGKGPSAVAFFDELWRDLTFGSIRWESPYAVTGYLLLPLLAIGGASLLVDDQRAHTQTPWSWLLLLIVLPPLLVSVALFRTLAARYILFIVPALFTLVAAGVLWLGHRHWTLGVLGVALVGVVAILGLRNYFGPYQKSNYREMAAFLRQHHAPADGVILYAPRQHLLAKYYLPSDWRFYTAPQIDLPAFVPLTAPRVVPEEMDGQLQAMLQDHRALWLIMTAQDEVDKAEFVPKYLTAVAFKEDCWAWLDVQLCHFVSPHFAQLGRVTTPDRLYGDELRLQRTATQVVDDAALGRRYLLAQLDWLAEQKPTVDYRVSLRLLDGAGQVVAQRDDFPIGNLLPPTTWNAGDAKPGYLALPLPPDLAAGDYQAVVEVYDPANGAPIGAMVPIDDVQIAAGQP